MSRLAAILLAAALATGCHHPPKARWYVDRLAVAESTVTEKLPPVGLTGDQLRQIAVMAFAHTPGFAPVGGGGVPSGSPVYSARVKVAFTRDAAPPPGGADSAWKAEVGVQVELDPVGDGDGLREVATASVPLAAGAERRAAYGQALTSAVDEAVTNLGLELSAGDKTDAQLVADLASRDSHVRDYAVRALADRRHPAAVPALIERLHDPDAVVVQRAVGALGQIRDPRAVGPLIDLTRQRDSAFVAAVARVIGDIGGADARAYLTTLAAGHPDPAVRRAAEEGLAGIDARDEAAKKAQASAK